MAPRSLKFCAAFALAALLVVRATTSASRGADAPIATAGPPTSIAFSRDARIVFVGFDRHFSTAGGIVAIERGSDGAQTLGSVTVSAGVHGIALTPDGSALVFTTRSGPGIAPVAPLLAGGHATSTIVPDGADPGSNQIATSADGRFAFYTNQRDATLGVARVTGGVAPTLALVAHVALDRLPGGIALSPDGASAFVTSEIERSDAATLPGADDPRLGRAVCEINRGPHGVLAVVDTRLAAEAPERAVRARVAAGCAPVRVALSPRGDVAWVSARGDDRALAFATAKVLAEPDRALLGAANVGSEPVGIVATSDGKHVVVAASDGEVDRGRPRHSGIAILAATTAESVATPLAVVPGGSRPRDVREASDGSIWVADYAGRTVRRLPPLP